MTDKEIQDYVQTLGYKGAKKTNSKFGEYEIYSLDLGEPLSCIGYPRALLVKENEIRVSEPDELNEFFWQDD